ncbi:enoyl-CoA hydratase/isomerase family protein [Castellaniella sp. S9]|uniref:enoyl-CoA hydratase/isomerase family protein n=1 Tax=Castellaniella sp. S9 TaxID=2993652 RepID=UPI0022B3FBCE|nr:enoyl-CoA hydratase/isomerase family protein [Castellaniella sp. S9]
MSDEVIMDVEDGVAHITLNRPRKMNAVTPGMAVRIEACCREADRDDAVRAVLISGSGERAFCAGSDLGSLAEYPNAWSFRNRLEYAHALRNVRKPVVAALRGWVLGGGGELALAADLRVGGRGSRYGFPEVTHGWVGGGGASQMLPRLIGYGPALKLLLLGEPIDAAEAHRLGLIDELVDDDAVLETARATARKLAALNPIAAQAVKAAVRQSLSTPLESGLRYENEMNTLCFSTGQHLEGISAFQRGGKEDT